MRLPRFFHASVAVLAMAASAACGEATDTTASGSDEAVSVSDVTLPTSAAVTVTDARTMMFLSLIHISEPTRPY